MALELNKQMQVMQARVSSLEGQLSAITANYGLLVSFVSTVAQALPSPLSLPSTLTGMTEIPPNIGALPAMPQLQANMVLPALSSPSMPPVPPAVASIIGTSGTIGESLSVLNNAAAGISKSVKLGS